MARIPPKPPPPGPPAGPVIGHPSKPAPAGSSTSTLGQGDLQQASDRLGALTALSESPPPATVLLLSGQPAEPSLEAIEDYTFRTLELVGTPSRIYSGLTPLAKEGLYCLLRAGTPPENLVGFLENESVTSAGGHDRVLRMAALLYDRGVSGFERAFIPANRDQKFLSVEPHRIHSLMAEYFQALWVASSTDAVNVDLDHSFPIDWEALSPKEKKYLASHVFPHLPEEQRSGYQQQRTVNVDMTATSPSPGRRRIVEVKTKRVGEYNPLGEELAGIRLQIFRHALLVKKHGLGGIEYVIEANSINGRFLHVLKETFDIAGVPYLIRLEGGRQRHSIEGGLTYDVRETGVPEHRSRPLQPLPEERTEEPSRRGVSRTKAPKEELPWTPEIRRFLKDRIPRSVLSVKRGTAADFLEQAQNNLRPINQREIADVIEAWVRRENPEAGDKILEHLVAFRRGISNTMARDRLAHLIHIAALAAQPAAEEALPAADYSEDLIQSIAVRKSELEATLSEVLGEMEREVEAIAKMIRETRDESELKTLVEMLEEIDPNVEVYRNAEGYSVRQLARVMTETSPDLGWEASLIERVGAAVARYDEVRAEIEATRAALPPPEARPVTFFYEPIPPETLKGIRADVLDLGPLPKVERKKREIPRGQRPEPRLEFDPTVPEQMYAALTLVRVEEDESGKRYFFPEELLQIDNKVEAYLKKCGWDEAKIAAGLPKIKAEALGHLAIGGVAVESLDRLIPASFVRSDLAKADHPLTGKHVDLTRLAARIWREERQAVEGFTRVVVMQNRRKIYFVEPQRLKESGFMIRYPNFELLKAVLRDGESLKKLLKMLGVEEGQGEFVLMGGKREEKKGNVVKGLKIVSAKEAEGFNPDNFKLHFQKGRIRTATGVGGLDLGLAWLGGRGVVVEGEVERALAASVWETHFQAGKGEIGLTFDQLKDYLSQQDGVGRLISLYQALQGVEETPGEFVLVGGKVGEKRGNAIEGLKIVSVEEAEGFNPGNFKLHFQKGRIRRVTGGGGLDLGLAWLGGQGVVVEGEVEMALSASVWETRIRPEKGEISLTFDQLKDYLSHQDGMGRLMLLYQAIKGLKETPAEYVLVGRVRSGEKENSVSGLKIVSVEEARCLSYKFFKLHVGSYSFGEMTISDAKGNGAGELRAAWEGGVAKKNDRLVIKKQGRSLRRPGRPNRGSRFEHNKSAVSRSVGKAVAGGLGFTVGEYGSELLMSTATGDWSRFHHLDAGEVAKTYASLTVGGETGRIAVNQTYKALARFFPGSPILQSKALAGRALPLFVALGAAELVRTGRVDVEGMPLALSNILMASKATKDLVGTYQKAMRARRAAQVLIRVAEGSGAMMTPATGGGSLLMGAVVVPVLEFTLIKGLGKAEEKMVRWQMMRKTREALAEELGWIQDIHRKLTSGERLADWEIPAVEERLMKWQISLAGGYEAEREQLVTQAREEIKRLDDQAAVAHSIPTSKSRWSRHENREINEALRLRVARDLAQEIKELEGDEPEVLFLDDPEITDHLADTPFGLGLQLDQIVRELNETLLKHKGEVYAS